MSLEAKRAVPPPSEAEHLNIRVLPQFSTILLSPFWRSIYSINLVWVSVRQHTDDGAAGAYYPRLDICIRGRRASVHRFINSLEYIAYGINI